jgi:phosphoribosylanthranilate isomerase
MSVRTKICGITNRNDACTALKCGADYIGIIVDIAGSRRSVPAEAAHEIIAGIDSAVVLMEGRLETITAVVRRMHPHAVQLIGAYSPEDIHCLKQDCGTLLWMTLYVPPFGSGASVDLVRSIARLHEAGLDAIVLDTQVPGHKGGTGRTCDWDTAAEVVRTAALPVFLAGGLTPENVAHAADAVRPFGVDVSSGVEISPGHKDPSAVSRFIKQARSAGCTVT